MIWVLFIMHLASHGTQAEETMQFVPHCDHTEVSDSQPISSQLNTVERSTECLASCEIKPVSVDGDNENIDANEETHLVTKTVLNAGFALITKVHTMTCTIFLGQFLTILTCLFIF